MQFRCSFLCFVLVLYGVWRLAVVGDLVAGALELRPVAGGCSSPAHDALVVGAGGLRGRGGEEVEEEKLRAGSTSSSSWPWSASPAAQLSERRRPPPDGRWSASACLLDPLTEWQSIRATVCNRLISFLQAVVPFGGRSSSLEWSFHRPARLHLATAAVWRQSLRPKWSVPGGAAVKLSRKILGAGSRFFSWAWGPLCSLPGLNCIFFFVLCLDVNCTWPYHNII
nr:uncharacterized protein LOC127340109 [Lolium perenne]